MDPKKYMVVITTEDGQTAAFFDDLNTAEQFRQNAECGIGALAEIYRRERYEHGAAYMFFYA